MIPTPIVRDNLVYVSSGYSVGNKLVRVGPNHRVEDAYAINSVMKNHHGGVILIGDHLYGYSGGGGGDNAGAWVCQEFRTGRQVWSSTAFGKGAVASAEGMLYCLDEVTGAAADEPRGGPQITQITQIRKRTSGDVPYPLDLRHLRAPGAESLAASQRIHSTSFGA